MNAGGLDGLEDIQEETNAGGLDELEDIQKEINAGGLDELLLHFNVNSGQHNGRCYNKWMKDCSYNNNLIASTIIMNYGGIDLVMTLIQPRNS